MKTGLFASCFALGLGFSGVALAAEPAPAEPKVTVEAKEGPASAAKASNGSDSLADEPSAGPKKTSSELAASTRDEHSNAEEKGGTEQADEKFGHGLQFGLRSNITGGYRMIFRYDKSPFCHSPKVATADKDQQKFCGNAAPMSVDVALSFGVVDFAEPYAWARFGLGGESSTNTEALMAFGVGARIYTMSDSKFKIFVEPAVGMEVEGGAGNPAWKFGNGTGATPEYKNDFLFHLGVGPQYDFARAFGIYVNAGMTTGVLRYIHTELELSFGAQVRVP